MLNKLSLELPIALFRWEIIINLKRKWTNQVHTGLKSNNELSSNKYILENATLFFPIRSMFRVESLKCVLFVSGYFESSRCRWRHVGSILSKSVGKLYDGYSQMCIDFLLIKYDWSLVQKTIPAKFLPNWIILANCTNRTDIKLMWVVGVCVVRSV